MPSLPNAPLVEAIFELRWGEATTNPDQPTTWIFSEEDSEFFPGEFYRVAREAGFAFIERPNPPGVSFPHMVSHRFRQASEKWPCYQIGLGLFTANQIKDGYRWNDFKSVIRQGLTLLDRGHPRGLNGLPPFWVELRYRDVFKLGPGETPADFIANKLTVRVEPPSEFLAGRNLEPETLAPIRIGLEIHASAPPATVIIDLMQAQIQNEPGFVMDTIVRSIPPDCPPFALEDLDVWLEDAHRIQKHAFETLIAPEFAASFQNTTEDQL